MQCRRAPVDIFLIHAAIFHAQKNAFLLISVSPNFSIGRVENNLGWEKKQKGFEE